MKTKKIYLLSLAFAGIMGSAKAQGVGGQCSWISLGPSDTNQIAFGEATYTSIAIDPTTNTPYVAYRDGGNYYAASVKKYVGGQWTQVGAPGLSYNEAYYESITVDKHGNPYMACENKGYALSCVVYAYNAGVWDTLAGQKAAFTHPARYISLTTDTNGAPYVAYQNIQTSKLNVLMYNGTKWDSVGSSLNISPGQAQYTSIAFDRAHNIPYVAFEDGKHGDKLMVYSYTGGKWSTVGGIADTAGITTDTVQWVSLTVDKNGNPFVSYDDFSSGQNLGVMMFNGTAWVADTAGRTANLGGPVNYTSIGVDASDNVYVAYQDLSYYGHDGLSMTEFTGGSWNYVSSYSVSQDISAGDAPYVALAMDNTGTPVVTYEDKGAGDHAEAFKYAGTYWAMLGSIGLSNGSGSNWNGLASYASLAISPADVPYITYRDGNNANKATVMSYNGTAWTVVGTPGISTGEVKFNNMGFDKAGDPICMFSDKKAVPAYGIVAKEFTGGVWTAIGTNSAAMSGTYCYYVSMAIANDTVYAAFQDSAYHMSVMKCAISSSATWVKVGPSNITGDTAAYISIAVDKNNVPYVAFSDYRKAQGLTVMKYIGGSWQILDTENISGGQVSYPSIQIDPTTNMPVVAYSNYFGTIEAQAQKFNGTHWTHIGNPAGISTDWASAMSLAIDAKGNYYVAYQDWGFLSTQGQGNCTVEKYPVGDTAWVSAPVNGSCSNGGGGYESIALDANGNIYAAYTGYSAYVKEMTCPTLGVNEITAASGQARVYPNPSQGSFTVDLQNETAKSYITVYNVLGENVYQSKLTLGKTQISLNNPASGVYLYRILTESGQVVSTGKLVIQ
jgi:hypothetical protein